LERAKRYGYCMPDLPTFEELCDTADDQLFNKTVSNSSHVLFCTPLCRHHPQRRSTTILGVVHTRVHCPNTSVICL